MMYNLERLSSPARPLSLQKCLKLLPLCNLLSRVPGDDSYVNGRGGRGASGTDVGGQGNSRGGSRPKNRRVTLGAVFGSGRRKPSNDKATSSGGGGAASLHARDYNITDYRLIPRWSFATQPFLEPEDRDRMSIGTLYVKVIEARGLMSADFAGKSDPYVKLCLTGRYLSHGQEWSEKLRILERTKAMRYTLDPVWNEEFSMPVRRAGAMLNVEVWDWDRSYTDDPLGRFQVKIGEELLSQKAVDMWYVLEAPRAMKVSSGAARVKKESIAERAGANVESQQRKEPHQQWDEPSLAEVDIVDTTGLDALEDTDYEEDTINLPDSPSKMFAEDARDLSPVAIPPPATEKKKRHKGGGQVDHVHESEADARACHICIDVRRQTFGEVRLKLWFQFDEFAEMCSHVWPEEPLQPVMPFFSPNQLYRKAMVFWVMAEPYRNFMKESDQIWCWVSPRRSLKWLIWLVVMFSVPYILFMVVYVALVRIVISSYLKRHGFSTPGHDAIGPQHPGLPGSQTVGLSTAEHSRGYAGGRLVGSQSYHGRAGTSSFDTPAVPISPGGALESLGGVDGTGGESVGSHSKHRGATNATVISRTLGLASRHRHARRLSGIPNVIAEGVGGHTENFSGAGGSTGGGGMLNSSSAPARIFGASGEVSKSAPTSVLTTPTTAIKPGASPWSGFSLSPTPSASRAKTSSPCHWPSFGGVNGAAAAVAKGGEGMVAAAGAGGKKIKKLLPSRATQDPELDQLDKRLGSTKKVPLVFNEVGKRLLGKSGPNMLRQVEKMGLELIKVREHFHPLHAKKVILMTVALTANMIIQVWLYHLGRFNFYFVLLCVGSFLNKLYKRWGKTFVMAVKEAARCRRIRLSLCGTPTSTTNPVALVDQVSAFPAPATSSSSTTSTRRGSGSATPAVTDGTASHAGATPFAFAPPGSTLAFEPLPSPDTNRRASSFFRSSPTGSHPRGSTASTWSGTSASGQGSSHNSSSAGPGVSDVASPPTSGARRGTAPVLGVSRGAAEMEGKSSTHPLGSGGRQGGLAASGTISATVSEAGGTEGTKRDPHRRKSFPWSRSAATITSQNQRGKIDSTGSSAGVGGSKSHAGSHPPTLPEGKPADVQKMGGESSASPSSSSRHRRGGNRTGTRGAAPRRLRVRWGRVFRAALALASVIAMLVLAFCPSLRARLRLRFLEWWP